jgi:8-oxo-dGTP pyrophosphatase MutT (NUDIX family)
MPISEYLKTLRQKVGSAPVMMVAVSALVFDDAGRVLLHRACDDGRWHTIGGSVDPNEEPADAAVREALEETALRIEPTRVTGVYCDPPVTYANGDVVLYTSIAFACRILGGTLHAADDESLEVRFFAPNELPDSLPEHDRSKIRYAAAGNERAEFRVVTGADQRST